MKLLHMVLDITDDYSYEGYLVHQFFILGPFSLMVLTKWRVINIFIILVSIIVCAFIVKMIERSIYTRNTIIRKLL